MHKKRSAACAAEQGVRHHYMKEIDVTNSGSLVSALFENHSEDMDRFSKEYSSEALEFCKGIALCFRKHNLFTLINNPSDRSKHVAAHVYVVINNIYSSMRLLMIEHVVPSGNMYRQSIEAMCMSILLAHEGSIEITAKKNKKKKIDFFEKYIGNKAEAQPSKAMGHLKRNFDSLKVREDSVQRLSDSLKFRHNFSHCSKLAIALSQSGGSEPKWLLGGGIGHEDNELMGVMSKEVQVNIVFPVEEDFFVKEFYPSEKHDHDEGVISYSKRYENGRELIVTIEPYGYDSLLVAELVESGNILASVAQENVTSIEFQGWGSEQALRVYCSKSNFEFLIFYSPIPRIFLGEYK